MPSRCDLGTWRWRILSSRPYLKGLIHYSSTTLATHLKHLECVFWCLQEHQFYVKSSKCVFGAKTLRYLGHTISSDGVRIDPKKIKAVREWPEPTAQRQVKYKPGISNQAADVLSRIYGDEETVSASFMALSQPVVGIIADLKEENTSLEELCGYLQPLPTPSDVWEDVSMNFIMGLPISKGLLVILVVVDQFSKLPLSLISYLLGSSKVAAVEELLVQHNGLIWRLKQNLVEARNKIEVKANRNRRNVEFNVRDKEAVTKLPKEFQEGKSLEKPIAICDLRLVVCNGSLVQQVLVQWDGRSLEEATLEWMSYFKDTYPSYNLKDNVISEEGENVTPTVDGIGCEKKTKKALGWQKEFVMG
nr:hypothetical protein [Tanacetum cinerariifolium]